MIEFLKQIRRFDGNLSREQNQRYYVLETKIETLQADHEALKKDVARFMVLDSNFDDGEFWYVFIKTSIIDGETIDECNIRLNMEYTRLREKLSKVGKLE